MIVDSALSDLRERANNSAMSRITEDGNKAKAVYMNVAGHELMNPNTSKNRSKPYTNINLQLNVNATVNLNINGPETLI